ncbi:hypothetical protein CGRA01v4_14432 [Colletotrichum graminicola]|uniref:Zn(2)-C6 fungal-type domain-containing protein n=1 Tax=Colletotrichum graminicola (strain M1.001 / M2 / FGSC 10212) TaxID=645133 RepID=E3Q4J8_COLGM|nr:uncharacterized protein GLRG_01157 [Colletotrichum graminicola M1.001]EFQ26013.1 hypothetical protein GLRG_01157 [Colletotrichum graminicola M1.001]WDK23141.1 hypothetical protein CGRA01v4_14432 [Colletotrichum graminicola]
MDTRYQPKPQRSAAKVLPTLVPRPSEHAGGSGRDTLDRLALAKKTRSSKPKVRTGCKTCKIRRVKCDEARPICERCHKARIVCDGYDAPSTLGDTVAMKGKPKARPAGAPAPPAMADSLMTKSVFLLKETLRQYLSDSSAPPPVAQGPREEDVDDIEYMLSSLCLKGGWTPFLKAQKTNFVIWDASIHQVPDLGHRSAKQLQAEWSSFFARIMAFAGQALVKLSQERPISPDVVLLRQQQTYLRHVEKWRNVLDVNLARATAAGENHAKHAIRLMQLHHSMISINLRCCLDPTDMAWDEYDDEFSVLVERCLAFAIETKPAYHARFTLNMGNLSTIGPAIAKCRSHDIRMRALEVARRMPWREGAWDAAAEMFGRLGAVLLEERGRDTNGFISAENRWTWVDGDWDMEQRKLVGQYVRSVPDRDGNPVVTSLELGLDEWPDIYGDVSCFIDHSAGCRALETTA